MQEKLTMMKLDLDLPKRDHVAIMKKSWGLLPKILSGKKTIESRWYMNRIAPWDQIDAGDTVYFKDAGEPVTLKANVSKVLQFQALNKNKAIKILEEYGGEIGMEPSKKNIDWCAKRNYCILVFLEEPLKLEPFNIDKTGYGNACAWLVTPDINDLTVR